MILTKALVEEAAGDGDAEVLPTNRISAARQQHEDGGVSAANDGPVPPPRSNPKDDIGLPVNPLGSMSVVSSVS